MLKRIGARLAKFLLTLSIVLGAALYFLQDRLLYYPETLDPAQAAALGRELRLAPWPNAQAPRGWLRETPQTTRGTVVFFHGNAGHALHRDWFADALESLGYRTLLAEYPGYGHRPGATSETALAEDAADLLATLRRESPGRLILAGESLGAGVAAAALARTMRSGHGGDSGHSDIDAVWLITPWNDLASVAGHHYPLLPVRLVLHDRYDSATNLNDYAGPKLVLAAEQDNVIPIEFARRLFDALPADKKLVELPGCGHNDWTGAMTPQGWREALAFLEGGSAR